MDSLPKQLKALKIRPKKKLGQHFVTDSGVIRRIVELAGIEEEDIILEVGAGLGSLTARLAQRARKVYGLELDPGLAAALQDQFCGNDRVEIILADGLHFDFAPLARKWKRKMKVVANLPYEISSPMIFRLFKEREHFSLFVLMLQLEVAKRVVASPGSKDYGPLSLWSKLYTRARIALAVAPRSFYPRPKVDSAVVKFEILEKPSVKIDDESMLQRLIRSAFGYRRKTLINALRMGEFSHLPLENIQEALHSAGIEPAWRGEILSLEQFGDLSRAFSVWR